MINKIFKSLKGAIEIGTGKLLRWQELAEQRKALLELDERLLKDIGLSRVDATREAHQPFWKDPLTEERRSVRSRQESQSGSSVVYCE